MKVVIVNCFETYESRVVLLQNYFEKTGSNVTVYTADFCHFTKSKRESAPPNFRLIHTKPYKRNLSFARLFSHADFSKKVQSLLEKEATQIDLIWALLPPNSLAKCLASFKQKHNQVCLIFDVIDMWPETMPLRGVQGVWPLTKWRKVRNRNLQYADAVVTECELYQEKIRDYVHAERLYNLYFSKKAEDSVHDTIRGDFVWELCYLGSINNVIDIDLIGRIIKQLSEKRPVKLHVIGDGERKEQLLTTADSAGAKVVYYGILYDDAEKKKVLDRCHFGLNIMKDNVYVGLTMKSMDYFATGLPMINNIKGDTAWIVEHNGFGVNYPFDMQEVERISKEEEIRERMRTFYKEHFSVEAFEKELATIMERVDANRN